MSTLNGVEFTRTGNPQEDLKTYMNARGISEAEAKKELEAEFGVAKEVNNSKDEDVSLSDLVENLTDENLSDTDFVKGMLVKLLDLLGIKNSDTESTEDSKNYETKTINGVEFKQTGDPQEDLKNYADARGISKEEAKKELEAEFGKPKTSEKTTSTSSTDDTEETSSSSSSTSTTSTDDDGDSTTTSSSTSSSDTSSSQASDREHLQNEIKKWNARLKQATDAGDEWGIKQAQSNLKNLQTRAYNLDKEHFGF